jgi:hypothetical protein
MISLATTVRDLEFVRQHDYQSTEQRLSTFNVYREVETKLYGLLYGEYWVPLPVEPDSRVNSRKLSGNYEPNTLSHSFHSADQHKKSLRNMIRRFIIAMLGGIAMVVPMLVMILYHTRITGIVTVSVATFLFAACVAVFSNVDGPQLLTAVATYAAVLVVFVGANGS